MNPRHICRLESPLGRIEVTSDGEAVTGVRLECAGALPHDELPESSIPLLDETAAQIDEYFSGDRREFDVPLRFSGTKFQQAIWTTLQQIGWGESTSYGDLGRAAGWPGSARAVGGAVGSNPVPLLVGCHRVLSRGGRMTGYSAGNGLPTKVWLLDHEGIGYADSALFGAELLGADSLGADSLGADSIGADLELRGRR
jgi:methylated-DNA-[protein]-cysteine S-methyltransferase